jgi:lipase
MTRLAVHSFGPPIDSGAGTPVRTPILALHGVKGHGRRFRRLAEEALGDRTTLAVDLRGHGDSTWEPPWDIATHVADLLETLDAEGVERVTVIGHSFGGLLATHLAAAAPDRVELFALLDPAGALPPSKAAAEAEETRLDEGWPTYEAARDARRADRPAHAQDVVEEDLATFLRRDPDMRWRFRFSRPAVIVGWSEMTRPPVSLAGFRGEGLLLVAGREAYVTPALRSALERDLEARLTVRTLDVGHMVFWDAFEATAAIVSAFVAGAPVPPDAHAPVETAQRMA